MCKLFFPSERNKSIIRLLSLIENILYMKMFRFSEFKFWSWNQSNVFAIVINLISIRVMKIAHFWKFTWRRFLANLFHFHFYWITFFSKGKTYCPPWVETSSVFDIRHIFKVAMQESPEIKKVKNDDLFSKLAASASNNKKLRVMIVQYSMLKAVLKTVFKSWEKEKLKNHFFEDDSISTIRRE